MLNDHKSFETVSVEIDGERKDAIIILAIEAPEEWGYNKYEVMLKDSGETITVPEYDVFKKEEDDK